jgi:hypothetical protein
MEIAESCSTPAQLRFAAALARGGLLVRSLASSSDLPLNTGHQKQIQALQRDQLHAEERKASDAAAPEAQKNQTVDAQGFHVEVVVPGNPVKTAMGRARHTAESD